MDCGDSVKECTDFIMNCYKDARKSNSGFGFLVINVKVPWGEG